MSHWVKAISTDGNLRVVAISAQEIVTEIAALHQQTGLHAVGLGESLLGGLLLASYCKQGERINLNVQGAGQFTQALVDAYPEGKVRGYVIPRDPTRIPQGIRDTFGPWGDGSLSVLRTRDSEENKQPYIGTVPLITGFLAKDLTFYFHQSEQVPSAIGISVAPDLSFAFAFMVQAMPGASQDELKKIEKHLETFGLVSTPLTPDGIILHLFQDVPYIKLEERKLRTYCNCSWERAERALTLVGDKEVQAMLDHEGEATIICDFCCKQYTADRAFLEKLLEKLRLKANTGVE